MSVRVPSFETLLELDGYLTGCYNGYRAELQGGRERRRIIGGGADQRISLNGLTMVIRFATSKPVRMSSEYRAAHPACKAQATTRLSQ
ncbi:MAG: hypothetical protein GX635_11890 [Synergistaceae bacterium]|nr:hypothetical protein [Synergistaceae bacterium]